MENIFPACSEAYGNRVDKVVHIIDLKDHKLKLTQIKSFLSLTSSLTKDNYPEILGKMYIINAGTFFNLIWAGLKAFLPEKTREKV